MRFNEVKNSVVKYSNKNMAFFSLLVVLSKWQWNHFRLYEQTKRHHVPKVLSIHIYQTSMPDWMQKIGMYINLYKMATFNIFQLNYQHTVDASSILSEILISHPETMEFKLLLKWKIIANVNNNLERWMPLMFSTHSRYSITKKKINSFVSLWEKWHKH